MAFSPHRPSGRRADLRSRGRTLPEPIVQLVVLALPPSNGNAVHKALKVDVGIDRDGCLKVKPTLPSSWGQHLDLTEGWPTASRPLEPMACVYFGEARHPQRRCRTPLAVDAFRSFCAGALPGTEAGHADLLAHLEIRLLNSGFKLLGSHFDGDGLAGFSSFSTDLTFMFLFPPY